MIVLTAGGFDARISLAGGTLTRLHWQSGDRVVPLLRDAADDADAGHSACFPLVPFGNRVRDNVFSFGGRTHRLQPNTQGDRHYLHGDGWLGRWDIVRAEPQGVELGFSQGESRGTPYRYTAHQSFAIEPGAFRLSLAVTNTSEMPLPFGLGWHPFFSLTPETTLQATVDWVRGEEAEWLPGERIARPADLDFAKAEKLPCRWINNGLESWDGRARIAWPERGAGLTLEADALFRHAVLFVSDERFEPAYRHDYFCFEPMSHLADGHHLPDLGGLSVLPPGETLSGSLLLRPELLA